MRCDAVRCKQQQSVDRVAVPVRVAKGSRMGSSWSRRRTKAEKQDALWIFGVCLFVTYGEIVKSKSNKERKRTGGGGAEGGLDDFIRWWRRSPSAVQGDGVLGIALRMLLCVVILVSIVTHYSSLVKSTYPYPYLVWYGAGHTKYHHHSPSRHGVAPRNLPLIVDRDDGNAVCNYLLVVDIVSRHLV
ncbi:hypothetical protein J3F84DRAFT_364476 [Trichoderma pleuroticola]